MFRIKGGRESPAPNRSMQSDEGWNQVQSKGGRNMVTVDPNRLKITKVCCAHAFLEI